MADAYMDDDTMPAGMSVEIEPTDENEDEDGVRVEMQEDGGAIIDFEPAQDEKAKVDPDSIPFNANLAEHLDETELNTIGQQVCRFVEADLNSRKEWLETYDKGLKLLGLTLEDRTVPWPNACGAFHPVMTEAVIRFQSEAIMELFPPKGPVRTQVVGKSNPDIDAQAKRIRQDMNWVATERMEGYRAGTERLLLNLPIIGSCFRKVYGDKTLQRPASDFVPAEDFIAPYNAESLAKAERYTHRFSITPNEVLRKQLAGMYRDVDTQRADRDTGEVKEAKDKIEGVEPDDSVNEDRIFYEQHTVWDLPAPFGHEAKLGLPYIVTVDKATEKVLSIYRNWKPEDTTYERRMWFAEYKFLPGLGFYGWGLIHVIGGLTNAATSILRQLVDAGTVANLPGGYKTRNLRVKGDNTPIQPGEWRDVDVTGEELSKAFYPMPYKEPSATLYQLLLNIVDEARRVGAVADMKISDMSAQQPVGTTFAILERELKVQSAVQARLHASMKTELRILAEIIPEDLPPEYPFDVGGDFNRAQDYDGRVDVIPVSDPNASTTAQRILQNQAMLQLSESAPDIYDTRELHTGMALALGYDDPERIIPPPPDIRPRDPVTENMDLLTGKPVSAGMEQDHEAHIAVHKAILDDPKLGEMIQNTPQGPGIANATAAHIQEHLAFKYRRDIERQMGVPLPPPGEPLPADVESNLAQLTAQAAEAVLGRAQAEQQREEVAEKLRDPVIQIQQEDMDIKKADQERKERADAAKVEQQEKDREAKFIENRDNIVADLVTVMLNLGDADEERKTKDLLNQDELVLKVGEILVKYQGAGSGTSNDTRK